MSRRRSLQAVRVPRRLTVTLAGLGVLAGLAAFVLPSATRTDLVAYVDSSTGIYAGDEVRVLGVPVGKIDDITPEGTKVRIEFHIDSDVAVPADASALIVAPSLVSSRYLQLAPRYESGPRMEDGAVIPIERTATPVEWDEIKGQLNDLAVALGPRGANSEGALSRLVTAAAETAEGEGDTINATLSNLAQAVRALDEGSGDAFSMVRNLQVFVGALAQADVQIGEFTERLDAVSGLLADNRQSVRAALADLSQAVGDVEGFVRKNRSELLRTFDGVTDIARVLAKRQDALAQTLHVAPNALANLIEAYHEQQNAVGVNVVAGNLFSPGNLICGALGGAAGKSGEQAAELCNSVLGNLLDQLAGSGDVEELVAFLRQLLGVS